MSDTDYATKADVKEIVQEVVGQAVTDLSEVIRDFASHVDDRFNKVETRLDDHDKKFVQIDQRFDQIDKRFDTVERDMRQMGRRFDSKLEMVGNRIASVDVAVRDLEALTEQR